MSEIVEYEDIPSDVESETLEDSEDEYDPESNLPEEPSEMLDVEAHLGSDSHNDTDEEDDTPLFTRLEEMDGIWEKKARSRLEFHFEEHVGPKNIPDDAATPGDVFLCLLSEGFIDKIVDQSNLYCN